MSLKDVVLYLSAPKKDKHVGKLAVTWGELTRIQLKSV